MQFGNEVQCDGRHDDDQSSSIKNHFTAKKRARNDDNNDFKQTIVTNTCCSTNEASLNAASIIHVPTALTSSSTGEDSDAIMLDNGSVFSYQTYVLHEDSNEQSHLDDVSDAYRLYGKFAMLQWTNTSYRCSMLPAAQRELLPTSLQTNSIEFHARQQHFKKAVLQNQFCLDCILKHAGIPHSQQQQQVIPTKVKSDSSPKNKYSSSIEGRVCKVSSVLKSLARDWSVECSAERNMSYTPIINSVLKYVPIRRNETVTNSIYSRMDLLQANITNSDTVPSKICIPGAGVGRLMCEISSLGYTVQGNEFSLYMLLASDFILNGPIQSSRRLPISPWALETRNVHTFADQIRSLHIPDVDPSELVSRGISKHVVQSDNPGKEDDAAVVPDFSMVAGDFVSVYNTPHHRSGWDCVIACFFLDASPCIIEYLQVCYHMLRPGGYLISFGPLLWHWAGPAMTEPTVEKYRHNYRHLDPRYLQSIDFCWEDIYEILNNIGFEVLESSSGNTAFYTADSRSMMNTQYNCVHFVASKPET